MDPQHYWSSACNNYLSGEQQPLQQQHQQQHQQQQQQQQHQQQPLHQPSLPYIRPAPAKPQPGPTRLADGIAPSAEEVEEAIQEYFQHGPHLPPKGCDADAVKLFVGNIPKHLTAQHLRPIFEQIGPVMSLTVACYGHTFKSKGSAFVWFGTRQAAAAAVLSMHGKVCLAKHDGTAVRPLTVRPALGRRAATWINKNSNVSVVPPKLLAWNGPGAQSGAAPVLQPFLPVHSLGARGHQGQQQDPRAAMRHVAHYAGNPALASGGDPSAQHAGGNVPVMPYMVSAHDLQAANAGRSTGGGYPPHVHAAHSGVGPHCLLDPSMQMLQLDASAAHPMSFLDYPRMTPAADSPWPTHSLDASAHAAVAAAQADAFARASPQVQAQVACLLSWPPPHCSVPLTTSSAEQISLGQPFSQEHAISSLPSEPPQFTAADLSALISRMQIPSSLMSQLMPLGQRGPPGAPEPRLGSLSAPQSMLPNSLPSPAKAVTPAATTPPLPAMAASSAAASSAAPAHWPLDGVVPPVAPPPAPAPATSPP